MSEPENPRHGRPKVNKTVCPRCNRETSFTQWRRSPCHRQTCRRTRPGTPQARAPTKDRTAANV
jgi:hypothetical protein